MRPPPPKGSGSRRLAAVWFADIVGFTRLSAEDEPLALRLVEVVQTAARGATEAHGGSVVKFMGDGVLAEFSSADGAAAAAIQLQLRFGQVTQGWAGGPHRLRVGVHLGDVAVAADGDIYGDGVNRASRLEGMAEPGQILVSEDVFRQLRQRPEMRCTDCGFRTARGIDEPIRVYSLEAGHDLARRLLTAAGAGPVREKPRKRYTKPIAVGMAVGIMSFVTLGIWTALGGGAGAGAGAKSAATHNHADSFSIAVLPFAYRSSDAADSYIADGIAEELIHALSAVPGLRVASRTSSFQYRNAEMDIGILAERLGVFMIVEGSVQKVGERLRITAQLTDADHDVQLWSQGWDAETGTILEVQQEIARAVVTELLGQSAAEADPPDAGAAPTSRTSRRTGAEKSATEGADRSTMAAAMDPRARDHLLRGRHSLQLASRASAAALRHLNEAIGHFREALALAPGYARAHLSLAEAMMKLAESGARPLARVLPEVREHLAEAARLDPTLSEAHAAMAFIHATFSWNWSAAEQEFESALAFNPTPTVRKMYAAFLSARSRHDEALGQVDLAFHQEPGAVANVTARGVALFRAGRYQQARVVLAEAARLAPDDVESRIFLARTYLQLDAPRTAAQLLGDQARESRDPLLRLWTVHVRLAVGPGRSQAIERLMGAMRQNRGSSQARAPDGPYHLAGLEAALGNDAAAMKSLRRAFQTRSPSLVWLPTDPMWEPLRALPAFQEMVRRIEDGRS